MEYMGKIKNITLINLTEPDDFLPALLHHSMSILQIGLSFLKIIFLGLQTGGLRFQFTQSFLIVAELLL